jgi:methionyl aminopeptidase
VIVLKSPDEIAIMRQAGRIAALALAEMREVVRPGVTTGDLDRIAVEVLHKHGATAAFLGYPPGSPHPFPATITASINEELVHGIPGERVLQAGDIVSLDIGAVYKGYVGDTATTVAVGPVNGEMQRLLEVTRAALWEGIRASVVGNRTGDVSVAIQRYVEGNGFNVVREYSGHGVGAKMHEDPSIPNWGKVGRGPKLRAGMTYALEPMVMMGDPPTRVLEDHWTVVAADGKPCAHFEHTLAITGGQPEILTELD